MNDRAAPLLAVVLSFLLIPTAAPSSAAEDVTAAELRRLAARAEHDPAARRELAEVRRVDGRPADLRSVLDVPDDADLRSRLRTLARNPGAAGPGAVPDEAAARAEARRILDGRTFKPARAPRPFQGALRQLGRWLRPVLEPLGRLFGPLLESKAVAWALVAAVLAAAVLVARRLVQRRTMAAVDVGRHGRRKGAAPDDPHALERAADDAEHRGDFDLAVRLRFRAGLLRLDRAGAIELRPSLTTGRLTRDLPSPTLRALTGTFEAVAYGGRAAAGDDVAAARRDWPRVLEEARRP